MSVCDQCRKCTAGRHKLECNPATRDTSVLNLAGYDSDGNSLVYDLVSAPTHGTLTYSNLISSGANGTPIRFTGTLTYTPAASYAGTDELKFRVTDGVGFSDVATVQINVLNSAPTGRAAYQAINAGALLTVSAPGLLGQAIDADGDLLSLQLVTQPAHGTVTLSMANGVPTGAYTYHPNAGFAGVDSFSWRVSDGVVWSAPEVVTIAVNNSAPVLRDRSFHAKYAEGVAASGGTRQYSFDLAADNTAFDLDQDPVTFQLVTNGTHGIATVTSAGALVYTPTSSIYIGQDEFTVRGFDGYSWSEPSKVNIRIDNEAPLALGDSFSIHHGISLSITAPDLLGNDYDFDGDTLQIVSITNGAHGTLTHSGNTWTFSPGTYIGTTELTYVVTDGLINSEPATIEVEITNSVAWVVPKDAVTGANGSATIPLLGEAGGVSNPDGDALTVVIVGGPAHGSLTTNSNGSVVYSRRRIHRCGFLHVSTVGRCFAE
ncbi:MAG: Ig-like domain-containing protein [Planctomycetaceae bacterium]